MANISELNINGTTYQVKDTAARQGISDTKDLLSGILGLAEIEMQGTNQYIKTSDAVGSEISYTPLTAAGYKYAVVNCSPGDKFTINADGGNGPRVWCFVDSSDIILANNGYENSIVRGLVLTAPDNAAKLIINDKGGNKSYIGDEYTMVKEAVSLNSAIGEASNIDLITLNYTSSYYINVSGERKYRVSWKYGLFDVDEGDYIIAVSAGDPGITSAIFKYENSAYESLVSSDKAERKAYVYKATESGKYGINSNGANPSTLYIAHKSATQKQADAVEEHAKTLEEAFGYAPALVERDSINRFSTLADMLLTAKLDCVYHDNFDRADSVDDIGYNFHTGNYIDVYNNYIPIGISEKTAYSTNPQSVTAKSFKLFDAGKFPYVVTFGAPYGYNASLSINFLDVDHQVNVRIMGTNNMHITINYAGAKPEVSFYDPYRKFTRVSVCVWPDHFDIYLDGRYLQTVEEKITSTLCGMMFITSADYRYNWFSVSYPSKFSEVGFDDTIEKYGLLDQGYSKETRNAEGIILSTDNTVDSKKSIRFRLNKNDELAAGSKRSEIGFTHLHRTQRKELNLSNKIYSFDVYFSEDYLYDSLYEIIFQLHHFEDDDNYVGLAPSTSIAVQKNIVSIGIRGQSDKATDDQGATVTNGTLFELERGRWYHFLIYQREAYTEAGNPLTVCFVDGECKFYSENINSFNSDHGTYPKWGIYKAPWKSQSSETTERTLYMDNIKMWY